MKKRSFYYLLVLALLGGCANFKEVKPIYPKVGHPDYPKIVDSLQPKFQWKPIAGSDVTYDLIIYECSEDTSFIPKKEQRSTARRVAYYREGVTETECKIEEPLEPNTVYIWSVRVRRGKEVSDWSVYNYSMASSGLRMTWINYPFIFKAPESQD